MKGQVMLIMVFALTFALFSIFMILAPIRDKILRIKNLETIYQAFANSEKGLEASLLDVFSANNLSLNKTTSTPTLDNCGGLSLPGVNNAECQLTVYEPITTSTPNPIWDNVKDRFLVNNFIISVGGSPQLMKMISDGIWGNDVRTIFIGNMR